MSTNRSHHVQGRIRTGTHAVALAVAGPGARSALAPAIGLALALAALVTALLVPAPAQAHGDGSYPRIFNADWTNNPNARLNARYDMVALSSRATPAKFDSIKAINPNGLALVTPAWYAYYFAGPSGYPSTSGPWAATDPDFGYDRRYWDLLENNQFWCWGVDSLGARVHATAFWGMWLGNFSSKCPPNAQGKRLCDVFADFVIDDLIASKGGSAKVDGVFFDQLWESPAWLNGAMGGCLSGNDCSQQTPGTETKAWFDLDADGVADSVDSLDVWWAQGVSVIFARFRERMGDDFVIVGNGMNHFVDANGIFNERFPLIHGALDPAPNAWNFRWQDAMFGRNGYVSEQPTRFRAPTRNIIDTELGGGDRFSYPTSRTHQSLFRFTLGSALLGNGYYGLNNGYLGCYYWLPEYDLRLGWPTGAPTAHALSGTTIWSRRFSSGEVWVNPTSYAVTAGPDNPAVPPYDAVIRQTQGTVGPEATPLGAIALAAPRPNPSAGQPATMSYALAPGERGSLAVIDLRGRIVRNLWAGQGSGEPQVAFWDGRDERGARAPSGVYFARLTGQGGRTAQQKLVRTP